MNNKSTRGRKKGSVSFVAVSLKDLNAVFKEDAEILVSRVWSDMVGLSGRMITATTKNITAHKPVVTEDTGIINIKKNEW